MSSVRIEKDGVNIPFVEADLRFRESNNSFNDELELPHAKFPIRIPENENVISILGPASITQSKKQRFHDVVITIGQSRYNAQLEIIDFTPSFRIADITYNNELRNVMKSKLYEFMPPINVLGNDPELDPYSQDSPLAYIGSQDAYNVIALDYVNKTFPEILYQFPYIKYDDLIDEGDKQISEEWEDYTGFINSRDSAGDLIQNTSLVTISEFEFSNSNVIAPHVFVLSPLLKAVQSIGYKLTGTAPYHLLIRSLIFATENNNNTKINISTPGEEFPALSSSWDFSIIGAIPYYIKYSDLGIDLTGSYQVSIKLRWPESNVTYRFTKIELEHFNGSVFSEIYSTELLDPEEFSTTVDFEIDNITALSAIRFKLMQFRRVPFPEFIEVILKYNPQEGVFNDVHPTIDFKRYLPDWSIADLINNLKIFNVKPIIDDVKKEFRLDLNEPDYLLKRDSHVVRGSRNIRAFDNVPYDSITLRFKNEEDDYLVIDQEGITVNGIVSKEAKTISSDFNLVDRTFLTAAYSEDYFDKDGTGIMIYNPSRGPYVSLSINNHALTIHGGNGIHSKFWKAWTSMLLDGSPLELSLNVTSTQLEDIKQKQDVFVNGMRFLVQEMESRPAAQNRYDLSLVIVSVNI